MMISVRKYSVKYVYFIAIGLLIGVFSAAYGWLSELNSKQFIRDFNTVNYVELSNDDSSAIAYKLNSMASSINWKCLSVKSNGYSVLELSKSGNCEPDFRYRTAEFSSNSGRLEVRTLIGLPPLMEMLILFCFLFVSIIGSVFTKILIRIKENESKTLEDFGYLAAKASHDLRSPSTALKIAAEKLSDDNDVIRSLILSSSSRVNQISEDLLREFRRLKTVPKKEPRGVLKTKNVTFDCVVLIQEIIDTKKILLPGGKIDLNNRTQDSQIKAQGDPSKLSRAIDNILNNSIESSLDSYKLNIEINLFASDAEVLITIADNGRGIPIDVLKKLGKEKITFGKPNGTGNGLGVISSFEAVESFGGKININSKVGSGTIVSVRLQR